MVNPLRVIGSPDGSSVKRDRLMRMGQVFNLLRPNKKFPRGLTVTVTVTVLGELCFDDHYGDN